MIEIQETIRVGEEVVLQSNSPHAPCAVAFEDDGVTGYFYGIELDGQEYSIVNAMHIYNDKDVIDKDRLSIVEIEWTEDGLKAGLRINGYVHAIFDFERKHGYCRTGLPAAIVPWTGHEWSDAALDFFN